MHILHSNSPLSKSSGTSLVSLQRLRDINRTFSKDSSLIQDRSTVGQEQELESRESRESDESGKSKKSKSKRRSKKKKPPQADFSSRLRSRVDKHMAEYNEALDEGIESRRSLLQDSQTAGEWLLADGQSKSGGSGLGGSLGGSLGGNLGSVGSAKTMSMGSAPSYGSGNPYSNSVDLGSSMETVEPDPFAQQEIQDKMKEEADALAESQQREAESRQRELEWQAAEKAQAAKDLAAERRAMMEQEFQSQQSEIETEQPTFENTEPLEAQAMASSFEEPTEDVTFQPDETSVEEVTAEELEAEVQETIAEAAGDGHAANHEMLADQAQKFQEVQMETALAREALAQEAPKFSQDLSRYMEQYSKSDSQSEQSMIRGFIEALLDGASDGMQEQVKVVREQVSGMFTQSEAAWAARSAAMDAQVLQAEATKRENEAQIAAGQRQRDEAFLKEQARKNMQQNPNSDALQSQRLNKALQEKGLA